jgi:antibiotic biosynthesis monooxygenase (ABM) superfamily enzyme
MSGPTAIPQTLTTMEACMTLAAGPEAEFWRAQERMGAVVAAQPGFRAVIGGPIANSSWMYFCGKFETPDDMDKWQHSRQHRPVIDKAYSTWFDAFYIRKWRLPAEGEELTGPLFCETAIVPDAALDEATLNSVVASLTEALPRFGPRPFETLAGRFETQPFQFVGPLEEFPQVAPVRYLLLTHWDDAQGVKAWLDSAEMKALGELGAVSTDLHVQILHAPGEREGLSADGSHRGWSRHAPAS